MRTALAPIEARRGEAATQLEELVDVDAKLMERDEAFGGGAIGVFGGGAVGVVRHEPAEGFGKPIMERDTQSAGEMVITSARGAKVRGSARMKIRSGGGGQDAEGL